MDPLAQLPPPPTGQTGVTLQSLKGLPPPPTGQQGKTLAQVSGAGASTSSSIWDGLVNGATQVTNALGLHGAVDTLGSNMANIANTLFNPTTSLDQKVATSKFLPQTSLEQNVGTGVQLGSNLALGGEGLAAKLGMAAASGAGMLGGQAMAENKSAGTVAKQGAIGAAAAPLFALGGEAVSALGKGAYKFAIPQSMKEAGLVQAYRANVPFAQRMIAAAGPTTAGETAFNKGLIGTESMIGVQAKRASNSIWSDLIKPQLNASPEKVNMPAFFDQVEQQVIKDNPELSRQQDMVEALQSLRESYANKPDVSLADLQDFKQGWAKFVPQKAYQGKDIAGVFNDVKDTAADIARETIYKSLGNDVKQAYFDYGNLKAVQELGQKAMTGGKLKGGTGGLISALKDMVMVPTMTLGGQTVYKVGQGVELVGRPGLQSVGDFIESMTSEPQSPDQQSTTPQVSQGQSSVNPTPSQFGPQADGTISVKGPFSGQPMKLDPTMGGLGIEAEGGKEVAAAVKSFFKQEPPLSLLKEMGSFLNYHDWNELPEGFKNASKYEKAVRSSLSEYGVDAYNMSKLKLAKFAQAVIDKAQEVLPKRDNFGRFSHVE